MLRVENVSKRFLKTEQFTLNGISFDVEKEQFISLVGASGCGKTTMLNLIAGLDMPTAGRILYNDVEVKGSGADRIVMFQEPALFPWLNVIDNVCFGLRLAKISRIEQFERAEYYLSIVKLSKFKKYMPHQLSGGMQQRVALARAMVTGSEMLLMDEPFSSLDLFTKNELQIDVQNVILENKRTVIYVTHSIEEAIFFSDRIIVLGGKPTKNLAEIPIRLPRPRIKDSDFLRLTTEILEIVRREIETVKCN